MASQPSAKLKAILAEARARAEATKAAGAATPPTRETQRIEALLDRNEDLPDPRALARMYREKTLVERLPEDDNHVVGAASALADAPVENLPDRGRPVFTPPPARPPARAGQIMRR